DFLEAETATATQNFIDNELSQWQTGAANSVCETLVDLNYRIAHSTCSDGNPTQIVERITEGTTAQLRIPMGDGLSDAPCCAVASGQPGSCQGIAACDDDLEDYASYCNNSPAICDSAGTYLQARESYIKYIIHSGQDQALARAYLGDNLVADLRQDGKTSLGITPQWSQALANDEATRAFLRVTDFDIRLIINQSELPRDSVGQPMDLGTIRVNHDESAIFNNTVGSTSLTTIRLSPRDITTLCHAMTDVSAQAGTIVNGEACENIGNLQFRTEEPEAAGDLRSTDAARLNNFSDSHLFGTSVRGQWNIDISEALANAFTLDRIRDNSRNRARRVTSCTTINTEQYCQLPAQKVIGGGGPACCTNTCTGTQDDPLTEVNEAENNTACYDFKHALKGFELKAFWRAKPL
ncbi:MAG: hypothetical protein GY779_17400, partial [Gammaproteobacteria bacterium]|nr:hypothetical protein [Gammaproteobacteria bacterium]